MNNDINFSEYCGKVEAGFKPGCRLCPPQAIIPTLSVETVEETRKLSNCLVYVSSTNSTYYIDDKHRITITWAGPVFADDYDYETNPLDLRGQVVYDNLNHRAIIYDKDGVYTIFALNPSTDFDELMNRPKYNGELMTGETDIPEVKTDEWDAKADATELAGYLPLAGGTMTGDVNNLTAVNFQWDNTYVANPSSAHPYTDIETIAKVIEYYEGNVGSALPRILSVYQNTEFNNKNIEDINAVDTSTIYGDDGFTLYINRDGTMPNPDIRHPHGTVKVFSVEKDPISSKSPVNFNGRKLSNVATPTSDKDVANKSYVDTGLGGKQNTLTAGTGISILNNVISATGGGGGIIELDISEQDTYNIWEMDPGIYRIKRNGASSSSYATFYLVSDESELFAVTEESSIISIAHDSSSNSDWSLTTIENSDGSAIVRCAYGTSDGTTLKKYYVYDLTGFETIDNANERVQIRNSAPTTSTYGIVGSLCSYVNSGTPHLYMCTAVDEAQGTYTWTELGQ